MTKISRNAPCPCGSGIKYKKCCLPKHKAEQATVSPEVVPPAPARARVPAAAWAMDDDDDLDELSNSAVDLIKEGRLDEAEAVGKELLERYPEVHDGLERLAAVSEARGDFDKAADLYRQAAAFVHGQDGVDPAIERFFLDQVETLEHKAKA